MKLYFRNTKTGKRFEIIRIDNKRNEIVLKGEYSEFTEPYDKERFIKNGYILEKGDNNADET